MFECLWCFIYGILTITATHEGLANPISRINRLDDINYDTDLSDSVKTHINNNNKLNNGSKGDIQQKFTDFIQAVIEILNKYDDSDIEHFFTILNNEVGKYHYNGCKFSELTDNHDFKIFIAGIFDEMKDIPAADIRRMILHIDNHIEDAKYHNQEKELIDFINSLYRQDSVVKFEKFLNKINDYRLNTEANLNLGKIIREGLRTLIFNHYTKLNYNTRAALKSKLDEYWEHVKPLPLSIRSQLHPIEIKLLDNKNENVETFYFTKKHKYNLETKYQMENWMTGANMKTVSYINLYPKLPVDLQEINYQTEKPPIPTLLRLKQDSYSYKKDNGVSLESENKLQDQNLIEQSMSGENSYTTAIVPNQMYEENSNDDANHDSASEVKNKVTDVTTENYDSLYVEDLSTHTTEQFHAIGRQESFSTPESKRQSYIKNKRSETTRAPYASLYTITDKSHMAKKRLNQMPPGRKKQVPKKIARTVFTTRKAFIEVVTMRPFVPTRIRNPIKIKYEINLKSAKTQPTSEVQDPAKTKEYISLNEDSANVEKGLSIEEIKDERGARAYKRSFNNNLPADTVLIDKDVLIRIKQLENELNNVKTQAKNDTEIIEDLKSNIEFTENEASKQSKEFVLAKVIPCNSGDKEITNESPGDVDRRQHSENKDEHINNLKKQQNQGLSAKQRIFQRNHLDRSNFDVPGRRSSFIEDMKMKHNFDKYKIQKSKQRKLQIHSVRGGISRVDNFEYKEREYNNIDTNEEKSIEDNTLHSRRAMINKLEEIKKKIDGAEDNHEIRRKESYFSAKANAGFNNVLIPDSDVFNRNMKELENYLERENNTVVRYDSNKDRFQNDKGEEPGNIYLGAMLSNDSTEKNVNNDKNVFALDKTEVNKEYVDNENVFGKMNRETLKEADRSINDINKSFLKTNKNKYPKQLENTLNHDGNRNNQVKNYGNRSNQEKVRSPDKDTVSKDNQTKPEFSTSINTEEDRNQEYAQTRKENKDSVSFDKEHNIRRSINFDQNILDSNKRAINPIHRHVLITPKSDKETNKKVEGIYTKSQTYPSTTDYKSNTAKITKATLGFKLSKPEITTENNTAYHNNNKNVIRNSNDNENITREIVHDFQLNKSKGEIETKIIPNLSIISTTSLRKQSSITGQYNTGSNEIKLKKESEVKPPSQNQHQNSNKESQFQKDEQDRFLNNFKEENVDQKIDFGNDVFRRSFVNNEPKESINNNKEHIKMNYKPFNREDFNIQDKVYEIDWDNINVPKMLDEISKKFDENKETAKVTAPKPLTMVAAGPPTRTTQTPSTTSTTTTATPQAYLPTDIFNLREANESFNPIYKNPFNMNVPKYGFRHQFKDPFRKKNYLPLAAPAPGKNIRIDSEEAIKSNLRSHLKVPRSYTRTTLDLQALFKKLGPMPDPEGIIMDKLNEHAASIGSGRRNMDANITVTVRPIAEHAKDFFDDPFLTDVENAFGTKQPSVSTLEDDFDI